MTFKQEVILQVKQATIMYFEPVVWLYNKIRNLNKENERT